jgi:ABC-type uncharacterized transport system permease subunit
MYTTLLLLSIAAYIVCFFSEESSKKFFLWGASLLHGLGILLALQDLVFVHPLVGLGFVSYTVSVLLLTQVRHPKFDSLLRPSLSIILLMLLVGMLSPKATGLAVSQELWIAVHVFLILVGYLCFAIGAIVGGMFIIVQTRLKQRKLEGINKFLSLPTLDRYNYRAVLIGFGALLSGALSLDNDNFEFDFTRGTTIVLIIWYAVALLSRYFGYHGRQLAWFSLLGFATLMVVVFLASVTGNWHFGAM